MLAPEFETILHDACNLAADWETGLRLTGSGLTKTQQDEHGYLILGILRRGKVEEFLSRIAVAPDLDSILPEPEGWDDTQAAWFIGSAARPLNSFFLGILESVREKKGSDPIGYFHLCSGKPASAVHGRYRGQAKWQCELAEDPVWKPSAPPTWHSIQIVRVLQKAAWIIASLNHLNLNSKAAMLGDLEKDDPSSPRRHCVRYIDAASEFIGTSLAPWGISD